MIIPKLTDSIYIVKLQYIKQELCLNYEPGKALCDTEFNP